MISSHFSESVIESAPLAWLESLGYLVEHGPEITPAEPATERQYCRQMLLENYLQDTLLPKLLSGEVRIRALEHFGEAV